MIQVGIEPKRLLNEAKQNEVSNVVADMPVYKGMEILVADADTKIVAGATDSSKIDRKLTALICGIIGAWRNRTGHILLL